jgi:hypothetical protein
VSDRKKRSRPVGKIENADNPLLLHVPKSGNNNLLPPGSRNQAKARKDKTKLVVIPNFCFTHDLADVAFEDWVCSFRNRLVKKPVNVVRGRQKPYTLVKANALTGYIVGMLIQLPSKLVTLSTSCNTVVHDNRAMRYNVDPVKPPVIQCLSNASRYFQEHTSNTAPVSGIVSVSRSLALVNLRSTLVRFQEEIEMGRGPVVAFLQKQPTWNTAPSNYNVKQKGCFTLRELLSIDVEQWDPITRQSEVPYYFDKVFGPGAVVLTSSQLKASKWHLFGSRQSVELVLQELKAYDKATGGHFQTLCNILNRNIARPLAQNGTFEMQIVPRAPGVIAATEPLTVFASRYKLVSRLVQKTA